MTGLSMSDETKVAEGIAELRVEVRNLNAQRVEVLSLIRDLQYQMRALRDEHAKTRAAQERMVNRGYGVLLGVAIAAGSAGASPSPALQARVDATP